MDKQTKRALLVTAFGVGLYAAVMNLPTVLSFLGELLGLIRPVIAGGILALFLHVPMSRMQKGLRNFFRGKPSCPSEKTILILSFAGTVVCVLLVLTLVLVLLIPEVVTSSQRLYAQVAERLEYLESQDLELPWLEEFVLGLDLESITQKLTQEMDGIVTNVVGAVSSTVGVVVTACFAVIVCIYISLGKQRLCRHGRKIVKAYLPGLWPERVFRFCRSFTLSFANFLTGQCTEAVILGTLMFLAFSLFRLPYASLVGILTAVCAIIPYVGAFLSSGSAYF